MTNVFDVAVYILEKLGTITAMKLQKLIYYSQAWALTWDEEPLFCEEIQAWANGPVVYELYDTHRGKYKVCKEDFPNGDKRNLNETQKETIDSVLEFYGDKKSQWLSDLTHMEDPWKEARKGIPDNERGNKVISHASMIEYYSSILPDSHE